MKKILFSLLFLASSSSFGWLGGRGGAIGVQLGGLTLGVGGSPYGGPIIGIGRSPNNGLPFSAVLVPGDTCCCDDSCNSSCSDCCE